MQPRSRSQISRALIERTKHDIYPFISPSSNLTGCTNGKIVLGTGSSGGIGRAAAKHFALAGAKVVVITGRNETSLQQTKSAIQAEVPSCDVLDVLLDITDETAVGGLFSKLPAVPDILVNNAGTQRSSIRRRASLTAIPMIGGPTLYVSRGIFSQTQMIEYFQEVNVKGLYLCSRAYLRALGGRSGVIVNVSSSVSVGPAAGNLSSYASAKIAVNKITEFIHAEHHEQGTRCIAVRPGGIADTGMGNNAPPHYRHLLHDTVNLAAGTILYLSTPRAGFLDGRCVFSNWDMEKLEAIQEDITKQDLLKTRLGLADGMKTDLVLPQYLSRALWLT
ncbi:hypothetical protein EPUS_07961 [Endocarpon pusillum Z07020]|uniref:Uncharacterized protein n=1 Tax=Endocarpon pusillum (strain Z07020 / HMAS-L-300199) TaxID=1263415 RepID=U1HJW8_ENDPU|nr:uncharacterized protein EPUS_07961 [Endocarpon pusillum Z07020]ERF70540.1 hypothetical protein EPUS_07961 [Endocarpon pusillum Z07020]